MKREIKFRVWNKTDKCWVSNKNEQSQTKLNYKSNYLVHWNNYELSQYTGLKDGNGKEIYEGDILKFDNVVNSIVGFENGAFTINNIYPIKPLLEKMFDYGECYVIGNIYENPELL